MTVRFRFTTLGALCAVMLSPVLAHAEPDTREAAPRTEAEREFILEQMRLFLGSVQTITAALSNGDLAAVEAEAAARGRRVNKRPPGLEAKETEPWKAMMGGARIGFDEIADLAHAGAPPQRVLSALSSTMANCVACHQTYRITVSAK
jgi:cytochrome c556